MTDHANAPGIDASGLVYEYARNRGLDGADLVAPRGEITALVGPNGAGKTTLMRILAGLQRPHGGQARVCGIDVAADPRGVHQRVAFMPDEIGLYTDLSAERHLRHAGASAQLGRAALQTRIAELARDLDLLDLLARKAAELSRGQRQRLAIAQALMKGPELLILDEPASGLDPEARRGLSDLLLRLKREGATILVSSHILTELDDYSDRVAVMRAGKVVKVEALAAPAGAGAQDGAKDGTEIVTVTFADTIEDLAGKLGALPEITVIAAGAETAQLRIGASPASKAAALAALVGAGLPVAEMTVRKRRLAEAYFEADQQSS